MKKALISYLMIISALVFVNATANEQAQMPSLSMKNANQLDNTMITGGQPSIEDFKSLKNVGVTTIINLRAEGEFDEFDESNIAKDLGLNYFQLPISGADDITVAKATKLFDLISAAQGKVVVHCASGNRVGALFAINGFDKLNMSPEDALAYGEKAGLTRLKPKVQSIIESLKKD